MSTAPDVVPPIPDGDVCPAPTHLHVVEVSVPGMRQLVLLSWTRAPLFTTVAIDGVGQWDEVWCQLAGEFCLVGRIGPRPFLGAFGEPPASFEYCFPDPHGARLARFKVRSVNVFGNVSIFTDEVGIALR